MLSLPSSAPGRLKMFVLRDTITAVAGAPAAGPLLRPEAHGKIIVDIDPVEATA